MKLHRFTLTAALLGLCATSATAQNGATELSRPANGPLQTSSLFRLQVQ
ncbi:MAG: hypothetical protein O3A95_00090 [Planctomycetota bacterium]|nr:hypothetical protein [Planctomycetota bacterium]